MGMVLEYASAEHDMQGQLSVSQVIELMIEGKLHGNTRKKERNAKKREELKQSIVENGIIQPLTVRPSEYMEGKFELICGYGRFDVAKEIGLEIVPVIVKLVPDHTAMAMSINENTAREGLGIVDDARAAQAQVGLCNGDYEEAAKRLGWDRKKVQSRLQLLKCSEKVLEALDKDAIKLGHAQILNQFTEKLQDSTLEKIITEGWTVETLKARAGKAQNYLKTAKFDTKECQQCPHNSTHQASLFEVNSGRDKCSNPSCWKDKTQKWLNDQKEQALEKYGKVLLFIEKPENLRKTVDASVVGEEQFNQGCTNCENKIAIMDDRKGREGELTADQCIDLDCFDKCVKAANPKQSMAATPTKKTDDKATGKSKASKKSVKAAIPASVIEEHKSEVQQMGVDYLLNDRRFKLAVMITAMDNDSLQSLDIHKNVLGEENKFSKLLALDENELEQLVAKAIEQWARDKSKHLDAILRAVKDTEEAQEHITKTWTPSEANIKGYRTEALAQMALDSGFATASGIKPKSLRKKDLLEKMTTESFDWSGFIPKAITDLFK